MKCLRGIKVLIQVSTWVDHSLAYFLSQNPFVDPQYAIECGWFNPNILVNPQYVARTGYYETIYPILLNNFIEKILLIKL